MCTYERQTVYVHGLIPYTTRVAAGMDLRIAGIAAHVCTLVLFLRSTMGIAGRYFA